MMNHQDNSLTRPCALDVNTPPRAKNTGVFAGPGTFTTTMASTIELTDADLGTVSVSGTFVRDDGTGLQGAISVFFYIESAEHPDDFFRGQADLDRSSGDFSAVVTDVPAGGSRLFLSFVIKDPYGAKDFVEAAMDASLFALEVSNAGCVPSLTITLEGFGSTSSASLTVYEPGGAVAGYWDPYAVRVSSRNEGMHCCWPAVGRAWWRACLAGTEWVANCSPVSSAITRNLERLLLPPMMLNSAGVRLPPEH